MGQTLEKTLQIDGTEIKMFVEFCLKFNCTLNTFVGTNEIFLSMDFLYLFLFCTTFIADAGEWGTVNEYNWTGDGVIGAVVERRVDIGFTALYLWQERN